MHDETPACIEFDDACVKRGGHQHEHEQYTFNIKKHLFVI